MHVRTLQGYDAVALSGAGRFVVGLDVCDAALQKAKQVTTYIERVNLHQVI